MACISPWPRIGLSTYIVCRLGASKPVSHMSRTITILNGSVGSRKRLASASRRGLLRMCGCQSSGSDAEPVITTLSAPWSSSSPCQAGRSATISRYRSTQIRRLMQTIIALPSIAASRFSKCSTRSRAMSLMRFSEPTTASSCAHLLLSFSLRSTSSPSVASSNSGSIFGRSDSFELELGQPALVVDRHGRAVLDGALDVVDADVVAEDGARVGVGLLDRRAGEADERGVAAARRACGGRSRR